MLPTSTQRPVLITNATVLKVETGERDPDQALYIENGRIRDIGAINEIESRGNPILLDAAGCTVIPGLIECHAHVTAITKDLRELETLSVSYRTAASVRALREMLSRGFTTVRDMSGADRGLAMAVEEGLIVGPRILFSGPALSQTGGHGDLRASSDHGAADSSRPLPMGYVCDGEAGVIRAAREVLRRGASHIKVMLSGGVLSSGDELNSQQFTHEELSSIVREATNAQRYVAAHAYSAETVMRGLRSGVRSIEHGNFINTEAVEMIEQSNAFLVPTLATYHALEQASKLGGLSADEKRKNTQVLEAGLTSLELANRSGVQIAFGSDLIGSFQDRQLDEFKIRMEVQQPLEVLRSATSTAARLLNMEGRIGTLQTGADADLLILDSDPLDNPDVLPKLKKHLNFLVSKGRIIPIGDNHF